MDIIPGTSKTRISPFAHLVQDAWLYPTPDQSDLQIVRAREVLGGVYQN